MNQKPAPTEGQNSEQTASLATLDDAACYLIERRHRYILDLWRVVGEFVDGSPWRDGRPVDDETMREEVKGYERTWVKYEARARRPDGTILSDNVLEHPTADAAAGSHTQPTN